MGITTLVFLAYLKYHWGELHDIDITNLQGKMKEFIDATKGVAVFIEYM